MKPALLIIMFVCTTTAACTARAVGMGLGNPAPTTTTIALDQNPNPQAVGSNEATPNQRSTTNSDSTDRNAIDVPIQLTPPVKPKTVISQRGAALPADVNPPAASSDDTSHSHAASWQSLLPGSIQ